MRAISDAEIATAEALLLQQGHRFNRERRIFIETVETLDLHAVPGSGKTTALLAKLLILAKRQPFANDAGILAISHTNAAVDEIKKKLGCHCPWLFEYPNFVGTIQSFVNTFLAIPHYVNSYNRPPLRIDNEIYHERLKTKLSRCLERESYDTHRKVLYINRANPKLIREYRFGVSAQGDIELLGEANGSPLQIRKPRPNSRNYVDYSNTEKRRIATYLKNLKLSIMRDGHLCFDDAYFLGERYLQRFPSIKLCLLRRFPFAFIDEMQDMDLHQVNILEAIFHDEDAENCFQRLGDRNQAIYDGSVKLNDFWAPRERTLELTESFRLSGPIARVVQPFGLSPTEIVGSQTNADGTAVEILPVLLIYENHSKSRILLSYANLIQTRIDAGLLPGNSLEFHVIAWNTVWPNAANGFRLSDFYPNYSASENRPPIDYSSLEGYLTSFDKRDETLFTIQKSIFDAFLKLLRLENVLNEDRGFTKPTLFGYIIVRHGETVAHSFRLKVSQWSHLVRRGRYIQVLEEIREFAPEFISYFNGDRGPVAPLTQHSNDFLSEPCGNVIQGEEPGWYSNRVKYGNIELKIGSVHSVKGQTHTSTLYLETSYFGSYESVRLRNQLGQARFSGAEGQQVRQSARMLYVGFSRPTHLLCFAVQQDRYDQFSDLLPANSWDVIKVE